MLLGRRLGKRQAVLICTLAYLRVGQGRGGNATKVTRNVFTEPNSDNVSSRWPGGENSANRKETEGVLRTRDV